MRKYVSFSPLLALLLVGCPSSNDADTGSGTPGTPPALNADRSAGAFADTDPWILKTTDPNAARGNHGIFLGNGHFGATFGANGGADKDSRAFVAGLYDDK